MGRLEVEKEKKRTFFQVSCPKNLDITDKEIRKGKPVALNARSYNPNTQLYAMQNQFRKCDNSENDSFTK
ncbi:Hypothetical predicted protein [Octopus vulgaris]|uniref:Uncharacterized protein n=1 Tax=Octopus vulgaris TaxID=6645 RepID=A0AA36F476_OCTVU|nr:Hypothetical predicted protein [Octopus vulgaris]